MCVEVFIPCRAEKMRNRKVSLTNQQLGPLPLGLLTILSTEDVQKPLPAKCLVLKFPAATFLRMGKMSFEIKVLAECS